MKPTDRTHQAIERAIIAGFWPGVLGDLKAGAVILMIAIATAATAASFLGQ